MVRQSASWWCFVPHLLGEREFLRALAETGYDGVELVAEEHWRWCASMAWRSPPCRAI